MATETETNKKGWIHCRAIIEVLGTPKEHIDAVLKEAVRKIKTEKSRIEVLKESFAEPKQINKLFSAFVELEFLIDEMTTLESFIFSYMPSSIEILDPQELKIGLNDANLFFNDLSARLHEYEAHGNRMKITNLLLLEKVKEFEAQIKGKKEEKEEEKAEEKSE